MKLLSWNVNGVRAAHKSGFLDWFEKQDADVVCLQEIKAFKEQLPTELQNPLKSHAIWYSAKKPGYSGVAVICKKEPRSVKTGLGFPGIDDEGRVLEVEFKDFTLLNAYFPNSQREKARLPYKLDFCERVLLHCEALKAQGKHVILCGDYNIAHTAIDLKNPRTNEDNAGYLPEERAWMTRFLEHGYVDGFRAFNRDPGHYTWWSYRPGVRDKNIGWRLDYFCANEEFKDRLKSVSHQTLQRGSDHCPVELILK